MLNFQLMYMGICFYYNYDTIETEVSMMKFHFFECYYVSYFLVLLLSFVQPLRARKDLTKIR